MIHPTIHSDELLMDECKLCMIEMSWILSHSVFSIGSSEINLARWEDTCIQLHRFLRLSVVCSCIHETWDECIRRRFRAIVVHHLSWYSVLIIAPSIGRTSIIGLKRHHDWPTVSEQISDAFGLVLAFYPERKRDRRIESCIIIFSTSQCSERLSVDLKGRDDRIRLRDLRIGEDSTIAICLWLSFCSTSDGWGDFVGHDDKVESLKCRVKSYFFRWE